ncbi:small ribosomal subunit protein uS9-like [Dysidea avara]|uniref:small ribosomal subunit protein uS9-like n=1 Tax=Dysidea avara TaxID=196820 RepID=UPI0033240D08
MQSNAIPVVHRKCQTDTDIKKEMEAYYEGRRRPAMMMGCDSETCTEQDVNWSCTDPDIKKDIEAYYEGRRRLKIAIMMGCDPETFTKQDVNLDDSGLVHTTGYYKSAVANVTVSRGDEKFDINGLSLLEAFPLIHSREKNLYPFVVVDGLGLFDIKATVEGGG